MKISFRLGLRQLIIPPLMGGTKGGWSAFSFTPTWPPPSFDWAFVWAHAEDSRRSQGGRN